ncbi:hypothetical protein FRB99_000099 [Tulasnella sp. 403]|nr:hypothetical protein FRB99_000099 [Tulasnella sp. 403]
MATGDQKTPALASGSTKFSASPLQNLEDEIAARYPFIQAHQYEPPEEEGGYDNQPQFYPRYNVAPRSFAPVIRRVEVNNHPGAVLQLMKWGVIPQWQKHENNNLTTINARSEALLDGERGIWSQLKGKKRCVVPVNGYYEWIQKGTQRVPYYMKHKDGKPILFAGMWEVTTLEGNKFPTYSFTIITTSSNKQLSFIHDRMPVILDSEDDIKLWLDTSNVGWTSAVAKLLKPYDKPMEYYQVPLEVGKVGTNDPSFVKPVAERKDGIAAMFKKQQERKANLPDSPSPSQPLSQPRVKEEENQHASDPSSSSIRPGSGDKDDVAESKIMEPEASRGSQKQPLEEVEHEVIDVDEGPRAAQPSPKKLKRETTGDASPSKTPSKQRNDSTAGASTKRAKPSPRKKAMPSQKTKITDFFKK